MGAKSRIIEIHQEPVKIDLSKLFLNKPLPFDVYIKEEDEIKKIFNKGTVFTEHFLEILKEKGINSVYIESSDEEILEFYISKKLPEAVLVSPVSFKNYSYLKENFYQIDRALIIPGIEVDFSIYCLKNLKFLKLVDALPEKPFMIHDDTILEEGDILIEKKDFPLFKEYVEFLEKRIEMMSEKKEIKNIIVKEAAKNLVIEVLNDPRSGEKIKKIETAVNNIIENILDDPNSIYGLLTLKGHDYYTYTHCVNVGVLSIGLGIQIKLNRDDIFKLGMGAILHDIGKSQIPPEILNKQGKLNTTEYNIIKQHVLLGYDILKVHKEIPGESFTAVLQHHERLSGKGYPFGIKGIEIKLFGRISAIADCYDALTTRRPYRESLTPYFALSILVREKDDHDPAILKSFIKMLGKIK
uniref:HD-GYP domain-containing protein n=1 Tax=Thermodesulfovibrio aggregans TaxID=86166 RepID=A0A7C4AJ34_9BACT